MKGEVQQVFIYIMVILVVGAVLLFGTKVIISVMDKACDVDKVTFQTDFKDMMEKGSDYGTIFDGEDGSIKAPCDYERLCILDAEAIADPMFNVDELGLANPGNRLMASEVIAKTGNNVFLIKGKEVIPLFALDTIRVKNPPNNFGFVCIDVKGGSFYLRLEGIGKGVVEVSEGS